jgi:predicted aldo/keto reductase-like oxidoreductase
MMKPANSEPLIQNDETMRYRPLGKTGLKVSALSFGCMRLSDDQELNTKLISQAVDQGVNYFETTRGYLGGTCQHRAAPGLKGSNSSRWAGFPGGPFRTW